MLKKIIIGFLCFIFLVAGCLGIYIYMLDWNQHKKLVEERFSQITGLRAVINGDLSVELFPSPRFTANQVSFFQTSGVREPLVQVNSIAANVDFMAMLHQRFILSSMNLSGATVNYSIDAQGKSNWNGVGTSANNRSGNIEVSFKDVRLTSSTFNYNNAQKEKHFEIPNISGFVSAPSLKGPYQLNLHFIHNENEIKTVGTIIKSNTLSLDLVVENEASASKITLKGELGDTNKGNISIDTAKLSDFATIIFGPEALPSHYNGPFYLSFQYEGNSSSFKMNNFNFAYGANTKGNGIVSVVSSEEKYNIDSALDLTSIDLTLLESIGTDVISSFNQDTNTVSTLLSGYDVILNMKSGRGLYRNAEIQNFNLVAELKDNILSLSRFNVDFPGTTSFKSVGKVDLNKALTYDFDNDIKTNDLRTFASLYGVDLAKLAAEENKKSIFKKAALSFNLSGNLKNMKLSVLQAAIDAVELRGNFGFIFDKGKTYVIADVNSSQILFDKYLEAIPQSMANSSLEEKLVYQFNLIPWKHDINVDARILVPSAVYNSVPLQNLALELKLADDNLQVKKLSIENIAGASLQLQVDAQKIYTSPYFKELSYDVKTNNFPSFVSAIGISTGPQKLFQRKLFASQGALNGSFGNLNLSSIQKFGDVEFAYTGTVLNSDVQTLIDGNLELKSNNFSGLVNALDFDYTPDIPVTSFALSGKIKGSIDDFSLTNLSAYLGANNIRGSLHLVKQGDTPVFTAKLDFDKFDADRYLNLGKLNIVTFGEDKNHLFAAKPEFLADKIDYSLLKHVNYDISSTAKQLVYKGKVYASAVLDTNLKDGILSVSKFTTSSDSNKMALNFVLNSNNIPEIEGNYDIQSFLLPVIGGNTYEIQNGVFNSKGHFKSIITSAKDFVENLNAKGIFDVKDTTLKGWDLDLIKFELEQRKTTDGLEDSIINNLKTGFSSLSHIGGNFTLTNGLLVTDDALIETPVADLSMKLDFNLANWLFTANFNTIYHNASFSDILKYTFSGNMADPKVKVDLSDSLKRISETEAMVQKAKETHEKELQQKLSDKINSLSRQVNDEIQHASGLDVYIAKYKPITEHSDVVKSYDINLQNIEETKKTLAELANLLKNKPSEKDLTDINSKLITIKSKLSFIPKSLEDNFMVDCRYIFNDLFDKIAWVYDVASNNSSYYANLTDVYWAQIDLMQNSEAPINEDIIAELREGRKIVQTDFEKINTLHNKMRENYVGIIETSTVTDMKDKNELTKQALQTLLIYTEHMNNSILKSLNKFTSVLELTADDADQYIIYPPQDIDAIDTTEPTTVLKKKDEKQKSLKVSKNVLSKTSADKKKEQTAFLSLPQLSGALSQLVQKFQLSHNSAVSSSQESVKEKENPNILPATDVKYATETLHEEVIEPQRKTIADDFSQDPTLKKKANETVLKLLDNPLFVESKLDETTDLASLPDIDDHLYSSFLSDAKESLLSSDSSNSVENKNLATADLNLKSGFKKPAKPVAKDKNSNNKLAILNLISVEPVHSSSYNNEVFKKEAPSSIEKEKSAFSENVNSVANNKHRGSFSGNIGKSMLLHHYSDSNSDISSKPIYIFTSNGTFRPFSGIVAKSIDRDVNNFSL